MLPYLSPRGRGKHGENTARSAGEIRSAAGKSYLSGRAYAYLWMKSVITGRTDLRNLDPLKIP